MLAVIPSPTTAAWQVGPLTLRAYALCILAGILVAIWLTGRRLVARGHEAGHSMDVAAYAVPFGIVGARLYHVVTTPEPYFGKDGNPLDALKIWEGGLGIWGAVALGALGAWLACRRYGVPFLDYVDAAAPGVAIAQAMGRFGNWFNNELYGRATDVPWGLQIHEWDQAHGRAVTDGAGNAVVKGVFHPTFLYEALWCLLLAGVLLWLDRRRRLGRGQLFGLYVMGYPLGRIVVELMRSDSAHEILGQRLNVWTSLLVFALGLWIVLHCRRNPSGIVDVVQEPAEQPHVSQHEH
ncbi:MAG: prolipoprotein diacylglyceryl transferase [Micrococcales bacterium]|nr:prolipoprotein diacylglyceryl transferase [Micrococcales bacterium]